MSPETSSELPLELIEALERTPAAIARCIADLSDEQARTRTPDDLFSAVENVCHLRDIEAEGYAVRIERILNEDGPMLPDIDGGRLAVERDYNNQNLRNALAAFAEARNRNVRRLRTLRPEQFARTGTLAGVGSVTLDRLLLLMQEHDEGHLEELRCNANC